MKLKVLKYDKQKARSKFVLFKLLELFGLFLFTFGFETLGRFMYTKYDWLTMTPTTYIDFWLYGLASLFCILLIGILFALVCWLLILLIVGWFKLNWRWAKRAAEDEGSKIERLSEQKKIEKIKEIEELEDQRRKYGYCIRDIAVRIKKGDYGKVGSKYKVIDIADCGSFNCDERDDLTKKGRFKFIKKKLVKPKLNKVREEEVKEHGS